MSKESLLEQYGPPKRKEVKADGREEWYYDTQFEKKIREEVSNELYYYPGTATGTGVQWDGEETSSGITFSTELTTTERSVSISPEGKVEGIPKGKIVENR